MQLNKLGFLTSTIYEIEMDHINPQTLFNESTIERKDVIQDNHLNLGLL